MCACVCMYMEDSTVVGPPPCDIFKRFFGVIHPSQYSSGRTLPSNHAQLPKIVPSGESKVQDPPPPVQKRQLRHNRAEVPRSHYKSENVDRERHKEFLQLLFSLQELEPPVMLRRS